MICIRIFRTRKEAELAQDILKQGAIDSVVSEDTFNNVPIQEFGVQARFRLKVSETDFNRAVSFLAKKLQEARLS